MNEPHESGSCHRIGCATQRQHASCNADMDRQSVTALTTGVVVACQNLGFKQAMTITILREYSSDA